MTLCKILVFVADFAKQLEYTHFISFSDYRLYDARIKLIEFYRYICIANPALFIMTIANHTITSFF